MSGSGNCYDNALAESFFHSMKTEWVYFEKYQTKEQASLSVFEYIESFSEVSSDFIKDSFLKYPEKCIRLLNKYDSEIIRKILTFTIYLNKEVIK
jgi:transposase InsO family protein